jgi:hypothetical protein
VLLKEQEHVEFHVEQSQLCSRYVLLNPRGFLLAWQKPAKSERSFLIEQAFPHIFLISYLKSRSFI